MRLTIIPTDKAVYIDGQSFMNLPLVGIPVEVHALQWYGTHGEIEMIGAPAEAIEELPDWANDAVEAWNIANQDVITAAQASDAKSLSDADKLLLIRIERNKRLAASDWSQLDDSPVDKAAWAVYRQALRDFPASVDLDLDNPTFPIPPQ